MNCIRILRRLAAFAGFCLVTVVGLAQTAATKISEGRAALAAHDLTSAQARFAEARALAPTDETAAALLGFARFFALSEAASTDAYLDRAGVSEEGRDVYARAVSPVLTTDDDGRVLLPTDYDLTEAMAFWRDVVAPASAEARADLAVVSSSSFLLSLTAEETGGLPVTLDRGDVLMCRALLSALEFCVHYLHGQDLRLNLDRLTELAAGDLVSLQRILAENPHVLETGDAAQRLAARAALLDFIATYRQASAVITARPGGLMRLFMLEAEDRGEEIDFGLFLDRLERSLSEPVIWTQDSPTDYKTLFSAPLFTSTHSWRGQLPVFGETGFDPSTIPDLTLGGVAENLTRGEIAGALASDRTAIEWSAPLNDDFADAMALDGAEGHASAHNAGATGEPDEPTHYTADGTATSVWFAWTAPADGWVAFDTSGSSFDTVIAVYEGASLPTLVKLAQNDEGGDASGSRVVFRAVAGTVYRVAVGTWDLLYAETGFVELAWAPVTPPANDNFANATLLVGESGTFYPDNTNATGEVGVPEQPDRVSAASVWYRWVAPKSGVVLVRHLWEASIIGLVVYEADSAEQLSPVESVGDSFFVEAGVTYYIQVGGGEWGIRGLFHMEWRYVIPATIVSFTPSEGPPGTVITIIGSGFSDAQDVQVGGASVSFEIDSDSQLRAYVSYDAASGPVTVVNSSGASAVSAASFTVTGMEPPPNDNFANATPLIGGSGSTSGNNLGATGESGEPRHYNSGGTESSVWFVWTAPGGGMVTFTTVGSDFDTVLAAYDGTALGTLVRLAENDDFSGLQSGISIVVSAGQTVNVAVGGYGAARGAITLNWSFEAASAFELWQSQHFTPEEQVDSAISGPSATPADDGVPNLMRFALGYGRYETVPAGLFGLARDGSDWVFSYERPAADLGVTYQVQTSTDLISWSSVGVAHQRASIGPERESWTGRFPVGGPRRFFRLEVTLDAP